MIFRSDSLDVGVEKFITDVLDESVEDYEFNKDDEKMFYQTSFLLHRCKKDLEENDL